MILGRRRTPIVAKSPTSDVFEHARLTCFFSSLSLHGRKRERSGEPTQFRPRIPPSSCLAFALQLDGNGRKRRSASIHLKKRKREGALRLLRGPHLADIHRPIFFEIERRRRSHLSTFFNLLFSFFTKNPENENETKKNRPSRSGAPGARSPRASTTASPRSSSPSWSSRGPPRSRRSTSPTRASRGSCR